MALPEFHTPVRGHAFAAVPAPRDLALTPGTSLLLLREPQNPADPLAVGVWLAADAQPRWRLGYLDRSVAARVAPRMDIGLRIDATMAGWIDEPDGRWRRPLVRLRVREEPPTSAGATQVRTRSRRQGLRAIPPGATRRRLGGSSSGGKG